MQVVLKDAQATGDSSYAQFRSEVNDLRKFVVLNYIAVIKAFKKRNRHLQVTRALNGTCASELSFVATLCHGSFAFPCMLVAAAASHAKHACCAQCWLFLASQPFNFWSQSLDSMWHNHCQAVCWYCMYVPFAADT